MPEPRKLRVYHCHASQDKPVVRELYQRLTIRSLKLRGSALGLNGQIKNFLLDEKKLIFGEISFVFIRSGKYIAGDMGRSESKNIYEFPKNEQVIPYDYWIACDPITNEQYAKFANELALRSYFSKGKNNHPVTGITWKNAMKFVMWMNKKYDVALPPDYRFDLPSPEEWEKAARGLDGRTYPWGDNFDERKCNTRRSNIGGTTPVGKYSPEGDSPYGARDMAGNVWEWTSNSISGNRDSLHQIMCGGSFGDDHIYARCSFRMTYPITASADSFGFRLAIVPPEKIRNELHFPTL